MTKINLPAVIKMAQQGDDNSKEQLIAYIGKGLNTFPKHIKHNLNLDPKEVIQSGIARFLDNLDKLDPSRCPIPYFKVICNNVANDALNGIRETSNLPDNNILADPTSTGTLTQPEELYSQANEIQPETKRKFSQVQLEYLKFVETELSDFEQEILNYRSENPIGSWGPLKKEIGEVDLRKRFYKLKNKLNKKFPELNPDPGVLVIEDSKAERHQYAQAALASTSNVQTARTIDRALQLVESFQRSRQFKAILVDLFLKKPTDGMDFIKQARQDLHCSSPIFIVSDFWGVTVKDRDVMNFRPCIGFKKPTPNSLIQKVVANSILVC